MLEAERNANAPMQNIPTAKVLIEALSPAPSPTGKAKRPPVEVRTLNIRVGLPQEDYPDQENMLVDLAQIMQVRRKRAKHEKEGLWTISTNRSFFFAGHAHVQDVLQGEGKDGLTGHVAVGSVRLPRVVRRGQRAERPHRAEWIIGQGCRSDLSAGVLALFVFSLFLCATTVYFLCISR